MRFLVTLFLALLLSQGSISPSDSFPRGSSGTYTPPSNTTIVNFNGLDPTQIYNQITHYDNNQNMVDAHDGTYIQDGPTSFYKYGTSYACGFVWQSNGSPFCGFNVYHSTDFYHWTYVGKLFDASGPTWQTACGGTPPAGDQQGGCFELQALKNTSNGTYVFWFNQATGSTANPSSFFIFTCTTPSGGASCTQQANPSGLAHPNNVGIGLAIDPSSGTGYIAYSSPFVSSHIYIQALNANFTDATGPTTDSGFVSGIAGLFFYGGNAYMVGGSTTCAYCTFDPSYYVMASSALGTWGSPTTISSTSCQGQFETVLPIVVGGNTTYMFISDQWNGFYNEGNANQFYGPLSFTGTAINTLTCGTTSTITGLTEAAAFGVPPVSGHPVDQQSVAQDVYYSGVTPVATQWRLQTFVPTAATMHSFALNLGQTCYNTCNATGISGSIVVGLYTTDGSNNPVTALCTQTFTAASLEWINQWVTVPCTLTGLTIGGTYAIELSMTGTQAGSIAINSGNVSNSYPAGVERYSTNSGASWITEAGRALQFATFP